jgi:hypothetical protein
LKCVSGSDKREMYPIYVLFKYFLFSVCMFVYNSYANEIEATMYGVYIVCLCNNAFPTA